ncbi:hypothetical protein HETIRDRAFT_385508 [Heterobasidion irregulare TC 32-1]|uniref:Uncharacterized protein n=1 Tax=Heterobasidion irregulare (strain TC 32-1) TaxID=747525 RepID=W4K4Y4_HETIT|nr:uncharacterized protein HETIRDRAFT_385508 [Heterobasidion irregulare TC 32-1]ETW80867.1 hypothetical protein HETIRDRAFT_385508 [Heterobasidion irregulare TC 32-1]
MPALYRPVPAFYTSTDIEEKHRGAHKVLVHSRILYVVIRFECRPTSDATRIEQCKTCMLIHSFARGSPQTSLSTLLIHFRAYILCRFDPADQIPMP